MDVDLIGWVGVGLGGNCGCRFGILYALMLGVVFIICFYMFRTLCAHHPEVKIVLYILWYHRTL